MGDPLPSLDELLGTEGTASENNKAPDLPKETADEALDRLLSGQEIVDEFRAAVDLMNRSARRLATSRDTGLATQRMQEDILRKLDTLIADAQQRSQQNGGSSSSSSAQQQQQQSAQQPAQDSQPQGGSNDNRTEATPPGSRTGPLGPEQAADLAAWGALPSRMRDALLQGSSDRFSATYRRLTEAYYRKLAEEPKK
ncbi:hypothetical protein MNBD_PLANCTO03-1217 [hydrothermal vent metagenome]|uniref:Uncharacterized protein n=1 Tax=hydrothermal vent metagenome TaxID=652676 RepID=A0A3B1E8P1_9ZZZZ